MPVREISTAEIANAIEKLVTKANWVLPDDVLDIINSAVQSEDHPIGKSILKSLTENAELACAESLPICQDTGMALVFCEVGQDVHIVGGLFEDAVNEGVRRGYVDGAMRLSVVSDPLLRTNTGTNTPAVLYTRIVSGSNINITVCPKGFGSENMGAVKMFNPTADQSDIEQFVIDTVVSAGSNPCPPVIVGVGLGGTMDSAAVAAKRVLLAPLTEVNSSSLYSEMERNILNAINNSNVGPMGLGGRTTALAVRIAPMSTHIAGLPCVVNISCHALRHAEVTL